MGEAELRQAGALLAELFAQARLDLGEMECSLWMREISTTGLVQFQTFAEYWAAGTKSRAPRLSDYRQFLDPLHLDQTSAMELMYQSVLRVGPYASPDGIADARLLSVIDRLGGWVAVCQGMPEKSDFKFKAFADKFKMAWEAAEMDQALGRLSPVPALGLCQSAAMLSSSGSGVMALDAPSQPMGG